MPSVTQDQYEPIGVPEEGNRGHRRASSGGMDWQEGPGSSFGQNLAQDLMFSRPREMFVE